MSDFNPAVFNELDPTHAVNEPEDADVASDISLINDMDAFAQIISDWHQNKIQILEKLRSIPTGTEVSLDEDDNNRLVLEGDIQTAFKLGLDIALIEMGTLPFTKHTAE